MNITHKTLGLALALTALNLVPAAGQDFASMRRKADATQWQVPEPKVTLGAIMVNNDDWDDNDAGYYTLEAKKDGKVTCIRKISAMAETAAALYKDNVYYVIDASVVNGFGYRTYSTNTWSAGTRQEIDVQNVPSDLTYDPVSGKTLGGFWDEDYVGFSRFASFSLTSAEASEIKFKDRDERDIFAIAADGKGTVYALWGAFDYLATFNAKTGEAIRIKTTGLHPVANVSAGHVSSMCYDEVNDRLLAAVYQEEGYKENKVCWSGLYEIDPATGATTELYRFDGNATFAGLYVADANPSATAPAGAANISVAFADDPLSGTVSFDAPAKSVGGAPLAGPLLAIVKVGASETIVGDITPGAHVEVPGVAFADGNNTVKVTVCTADERGAIASTEVWAGEDSPLPVEGLSLAVADGTATLTWNAPTAAGANGGALKPANLRYKITRYPGATVVAEAHESCTFTDSNIDASWKAMYYTVAAFNSKGSAAAVASNKCPAAGALPIPFVEGFDTADDFSAWTVVDINGAAKSWSYDSKAARYVYNDQKLKADAWLISPPLDLRAGQAYRISYSYKAQSKSYPEAFELMLGDAATPSALTQQLAKHTGIVNVAYETAQTTFSVAKEGLHHIALHAISEPYMYYMYVDDIHIEAIDSRVPAAVADLTVTPAAEGALSATVSFTVPEFDADGGRLNAVVSATVMRADKAEPVAVLTDLTPGEAASFNDAVDANGTYTYTVTVANEIGTSAIASAKAFIGCDVPAAVTELRIRQVNGHPQLIWQVPTVGANGGYLDPNDAIRVRIVRSDGTALAEITGTNHFEDTEKTATAVQEPLWYLVTPYNSLGKGAYNTTSDIFLLGKPYAPVKAETFAGADMVYEPWMTLSTNGADYAWTLDPSGAHPATADQSGDRGLATFHSVGEAVGTESWFYSPNFDLSGIDDASLSFWMYHSPSIAGDGVLEVRIEADGSEYYEPYGSYRRDDADADGWQRHTISLKPLAGAQTVRFAFVGTADAVADIYLDNVSVVSIADTEAALTAFSGPAKIAAGEPAELSVKVLNSGAQTIGRIDLTVADGTGAVLARRAIEGLEPSKEAVVDVVVALSAEGVHTLTAAIEAEGDADASNNSSSITIKAVAPVVPAPSGLEVAAADGAAVLSWCAPTADGVITDDVESYSPWAIDGIGEWTMHDGDYDYTVYISYDAGEYANATARKAFQVLDVKKLGIDIWDEGKAHSGNRMFAALASVNYVNDDWLISPRLNGAEQWISFYARSFTLQNTPAERMRVLYSTTDTDPANFTAVTTGYVELDGTWREYRYYLPEGARYFAVNCVSDSSFAMFVDDLSFNDLSVPAWTITGYEVLRDGDVIATVTEPAYTDDTAADQHVYAVRAVYGEHGTGPESEAVSFTQSGIFGLDADGKAIEGYYTLDGLRLDAPLTDGLYLVRYTDGTVRRLMWKGGF